MYILDEIDAALDLSHTQHIGTLFRTRFRKAHFIVVSLKEGLIPNAIPQLHQHRRTNCTAWQFVFV